MRLLLDTHVLLWAIATPERLPDHLRTAIASPINTILFSTVSIWEVAIKAALDKPGFENDPSLILHEAKAIGFVEQLITSQQTIAAASLPAHHRDPFDRLLVGQAMSGPSRLITADKLLARYSELVDVI